MTPSIHDVEAVDDFCRGRRIDPHRLKRLRHRFFKQFRGADAALAEIPAEHRGALADGFRFHCLRLDQRLDSNVDGATKLAFRTGAGRRIESVLLRIASGRTTLCVSCQVGCGAGCSFCATGRMGLSDQLSAEQILDQVVQAGQLVEDEGRTLRNVVFMGMGEPFHNERAVHEALDVLLSPACFNLPARRVVVSTVGIPEAMVRFARRFARVRLAVSLHSARQEIRERLVPIARRYPLASLRETIREVADLQGQPVMIEYLLLRGVNDGAEDLRALVEYLTGLSVHVNLMPLNAAGDSVELRGTSRPDREAFANALKEAGFTVTLRRSLGRDIAAGCGQLVRPQ